MKTSEFNFKKHQNKRKDRKMLVRFIIYITVIIFLVAFILLRQKTKVTVKDSNKDTIQQFDIEIDSLDVVNHKIR